MRASDCDWSGVNLYAADIDNIDLRAADREGADLGGITSFNNAFLYGTPWWEAKRISSQLLEYLIQKSPYDNKILYGTEYVHVSQQDYQDKISRLRNEKSGGERDRDQPLTEDMMDSRLTGKSFA